jgi:hypothetical protein
VVAAAAGCFFLVRALRPQKPLPVQGVVLVADNDPRKQTSITGAQVTARFRTGSASASSDVSGLFTVNVPAKLRGQKLMVRVAHSGYQPLELQAIAGAGDLVIARMESSAPVKTAVETSAETVISNIRIRYSGKATTTANIGTIAEPFEVANKGNIPCNNTPPCSPDNQWKASAVPYSADAGEGNELRSIRLSCIAGPCPFTRIDSQDLSQDRRTLKGVIRNWSDTTTFLLEAEVSQTRMTDVIRLSYAVIFGSTMSFTLPPEAEGPTIEAEINRSGNDTIFPMGPDLIVSWANCSVKLSEQGNLYRCELKDGYRFK